MSDIDDLINDLQEYLQEKQPPYLRKLDRLHPDALIYRMLLKLEDMEAEIRELQVEKKDLESEIDDLEYDIARLENDVNR
jgi:peptidoglycan hydrolase CwlO-like protein